METAPIAFRTECDGVGGRDWCHYFQISLREPSHVKAAEHLQPGTRASRGGA